MRALYDSEADAVGIELERQPRADRGDDATPGAIVHLRAGRPVAVDLHGAAEDVDGPLEAVAERHGLDLPALRAAAHSALAAPDRVVILDVRSG